jgi:hypothetical protein
MLFSDILDKIFYGIDNIESITDNKCAEDLDKDQEIPDFVKKVTGIPVNGINDWPEQTAPGGAGSFLVLGEYGKMASPGSIKFFKNNILRYSYYLVNMAVRDGIPFGYDLLMDTVLFIVYDVWHHESLHYFCDYMRLITKAAEDREYEESIAVAHSYNELKRKPRYSNPFWDVYSWKLGHDFIWQARQNKEQQLFYKKRAEVIFDFLMKNHFGSFKLPGYKDWQARLAQAKLLSGDLYETVLFDFVKSADMEILMQNKVPINTSFLKVLDKIGTKGVLVSVV